MNRLYRGSALFKVVFFLFIFAFAPGALAGKDFGEAALQGFLNNCFKGDDTFQKVESNFVANGWDKGQLKDRYSISNILAISAEASKKLGTQKLEVFGKSVGKRRLVAVVSSIDKLPNIGCYIYAQFAEYEKVESRLGELMKTKPQKSGAYKGNLRKQEWYRTQSTSILGSKSNLSFKYTYIYPRSRLHSYFGFPGISLATSMLKKGR